MPYRISIVCSLLFCVCACRAEPIVLYVDPGDTAAVGLKIGLVADTQVTSKEKVVWDNRSKWSDAIANVAIRTPAQEYLALEHLGYLLDDLVNESPDLILYLGDGANSGCVDEIDSFFDVLISARKKAPIFFVVGNHDYLGTGNDAAIKDRKSMCGGKAFYSKKELNFKIMEFNRESFIVNRENKLFVSYKDNFGDASINEMNVDEGYCGSDSADQHRKSCFYVAALKYHGNGASGDLLLMDTSDYTDINVLPEIFSKDFYGTRGSISWEEDTNSQNDWVEDYFQKNISNADDMRLIASHYPIKDLNYSDNWTGRPGELLKEDGTKNVWLSAHSHNPSINLLHKGTLITDKSTKEQRTVREYNVGSTTDYWPHVAIIKDLGGRSNIHSIPSVDNFSSCHFMNEKYDSVTSANGYAKVFGGVQGDMALGITSYYRYEKWKFKDTVASRRNIDQFLGQMTSLEREEAVRCMVFKASIIEHGMKGLVN